MGMNIHTNIHINTAPNTNTPALAPAVVHTKKAKADA